MKKVRRQSDLDRASPKLPFINAAEGRLHQKKQTQMQQKQTIETFLLNARRALLEGKFDAAYATGTELLRTAVEIHGMNSTELIPSYLILGAACMGLSRIPQAEKYLSQAQWLLLKNPSCDNSVKCRVFRQLGLLYTAQRKFEKARHSLAEDIYHSSMTYGCSSVDVAAGYYHLGNVFFQEDRAEVGNSLHDHVLKVWKEFFQASRSTSSSPGTKPTKAVVSQSSSQTSIAQSMVTLATDDYSLNVVEQIEAIQMLQTIRMSREKQTSTGLSPLILIDVYYTLCLLYEFLGNQSLVIEYGEKARQLNNSQEVPDQQVTENLTLLLNSVS